MEGGKEIHRVIPRPLPDAEKNLYFDPNSNYTGILLMLKTEFDTRWQQNAAATENGLDGFEEKYVIGNGTFGRVKMVKEVSTGKISAVKIMMKSKIVKLNYIHNVLNEKRVLSSVRFPFVMHSTFTRKDFDYLYLGMPLMHGGDLFALHLRNKRFDENQARFYAAQICLGLEYLHSIQLAYRDLKLENTLIDAYGFVRLADFGFTKLVENRTLSLCGTPEYLSPELIQSKPYFSGPDWWAFGIFIYELVDGKTPFSKYTSNHAVMYEHICAEDYTIPRNFSNPLKDLVNSLLVADMSKRLGCFRKGALDVKNHAWFTTIDWTALLRKDIPPPWIPDVIYEDDLQYFSSSPSLPTISSPTNRFPKEFQDF